MRELERQQKEAKKNADRIYVCTGNLNEYSLIFKYIKSININVIMIISFNN